MNQPKLFTPIRVGAIDLAEPRRDGAADAQPRAARGRRAMTLNAEYYPPARRRRACMITEGTQISPEGKGYACTPGIYSDAQIAGWKKVTDAVHAKGGKIVAQIWHVGRISHTSLQPNGQAPVAPSPSRAASKTFDGTGFVDTSRAPRAGDGRDRPRDRATTPAPPAMRARPGSTGSRFTARTAI